MKYYLLVTGMIFCWLACIAQKREIISKSTIKLEGKGSAINNLIKIGGYYTDGFGSNLLFFEDGSYVPITFKHDATTTNIEKNLSEWIVGWIDRKQINWYNYWHINWGVYHIVGDTIIGNVFVKGNFWSGWSFNEERYEIIDSVTIKQIYWKGLLKAEQDCCNSRDFWSRLNFRFHFIPAASLPPPDCWLKEEKWIWRNEQDWKDYMQKIKQKKKKKKK